jgi:hypothetical protein
MTFKFEYLGKFEFIFEKEFRSESEVMWAILMKKNNR